MTWNGFEIKCVDIDSDSEFDDQRAIERFGIMSPSLNVKSADVVIAIQASKTDSRPHVHLKIDGEVIIPSVDKDEEGRRYLRASNGLSSEDPLLNLPACDKFKRHLEAKKKGFH